MKQLRKLLSLSVVVTVLVVTMAAGVNCGNDKSPQVAGEIVQDGETATSNPIDPVIPVLQNDNGETTTSNPTDSKIPVLQSDILITRLEVTDYGSELLRGSTFSVLVQVTN